MKILNRIIDEVVFLLHCHFDKIFLAVLFFGSAHIIASHPENKELACVGY